MAADMGSGKYLLLVNLPGETHRTPEEHCGLAFIRSFMERCGIEADGDIEEIIQATGSVATDTLPGDEPIDICQVKKGEKGISHFITEHIAPFYERRWGGFLRDFKQNRII